MLRATQLDPAGQSTKDETRFEGQRVARMLWHDGGDVVGDDLSGR